MEDELEWEPASSSSDSEEEKLSTLTPSDTGHSTISSLSSSVVTRHRVTADNTPRTPTVTAPFDPSMHLTKQLGKPVIVLKDINKSYAVGSRKEFVAAIRGISLAEVSEFPPIREGEFLMIRGKSGCGKTTLLNIIGTIDRPSGGSLYINGTKITKRSKDSFLAQLRLHTIGFVFQTFNLLSTLSALENVELPMILLGRMRKRAIRKRAIALLKSIGMQDRLGHLPSELSGGEQQRVTIARALANNPPILLLDEPTGSLPTAQTIEIMDLLLDINRTRGVTMIMVSHNPDVECYADRVIYLRDGRVVKQAINDEQRPLNLKEYLAFLNAKEKENKRVMLEQMREADRAYREAKAAAQEEGGEEKLVTELPAPLADEELDEERTTGATEEQGDDGQDSSASPSVSSSVPSV